MQVTAEIIAWPVAVMATFFFTVMCAGYTKLLNGLFLKELTPINCFPRF